MKKIIQVPVDGIRGAVRDGISDRELIRKFGLSEKGLKSVFDKIMKAMSSGERHIEVECED